MKLVPTLLCAALVAAALAPVARSASQDQKIKKSGASGVAGIEATLDELDRIEELRAEEELHRRRLGQLRRLHVLAAGNGWEDRLVRIEELGRLERERHVGELGQIRVAMRENLFQASLHGLASGRERSAAGDLPASLRPGKLDALGVPIGVARRPPTKAQEDRRAARERMDREKERLEAQRLQRQVDKDHKRLEAQKQRGEAKRMRSGTKRGNKKKDGEVIEDGALPPEGEAKPRRKKDGGRRRQGRGDGG